MVMNRIDNVNDKVDKIRKILSESNFDAIEITSQANFSYISGGRGFIGLASTVACGSLLITQEKVVLISENIEIDRLYNEQLDAHPQVEKQSFPWDKPQKRALIMEELTKNLRLASENDLAAELFSIRTVMTPYDIDQMKQLSLESASILENICKTLTPGMTEYELAGQISKALWEQNIEPITILIGFDERALSYRHPVMNGAKLKNYALIGICARRNGLITSISRDVLIEADKAMMEKHTKCAYVNAAFLDNLEIGSTLGQVYQKAVAVYAKEGYPGEEKFHHQGGLTGFIPRELKAMSESMHRIRENELYAFNPTLQGAKVEDTVLVTKEGIVNLTDTGNYTYVDIEINGKTYKTPTVYVVKK